MLKKQNTLAKALVILLGFSTNQAFARDISELIYEHKDGICVVYQDGTRATIADESPVALQDGGRLDLTKSTLTYVGPYGRKVSVDRTALLKLGNGDTISIDTEQRKRCGASMIATDIAPTKTVPSHQIKKVNFQSRELAMLTYL